MIKHRKRCIDTAESPFNLPDLTDVIDPERGGDFALTLYEIVGNRKRPYSFSRFIRSALLMLIDALCNARLIFYPGAIEGRHCTV